MCLLTFQIISTCTASVVYENLSQAAEEMEGRGGGSGDAANGLLDSVLTAKRELADLALERERDALSQELTWTQIRAKR